MKKGFTLIELLVVIAILGILATGIIAIINPSAQLKKARDVRRKTELHQISAALELYRADHGNYPISDWKSSDSGSDPWISGLTSEYIKTVPKDPSNTGGYPFNGGHTYGYFSQAYNGAPPGSSYILTARLENTSDPDVDKTIPYGTGTWPPSYYTGLYTITNP